MMTLLFQDPRGLPGANFFTGLNQPVEEEPQGVNDQEHWENYRDNFREQWGLGDEQLTDEGLAEMYRDEFPTRKNNNVEENLTRPVVDPVEAEEVRLQQYHLNKINRYNQAKSLLDNFVPLRDEGLSYTDLEAVHKINGGEKFNTIVSPEGEVALNPEVSRMGRGSLFHSLWEQVGGKFTEDENKYFDTFDRDETSNQRNMLSDSEVKQMMSDGGVEGPTFKLMDQEHTAAQDHMNGNITMPEDYLHVGQEGSEFRPTPQGGGPSLAHGLASGGAGMLASTLVDYSLANTEFGEKQLSTS